MSDKGKDATNTAQSACNDLLSKIINNNTAIRPCVVDGDEDDNYTVWLIIGVQEFCVTAYAGNLEESKWTQDLLARALIRLIEQER
jgi:hypothetical protein